MSGPVRSAGRGRPHAQPLLGAALLLLALSGRPAQAQSTPPEGPGPAAEQRYYVSNALGMPLEEVGWYRREEFPYLLVVQTAGGREIRRLLGEGRELRRWERTGAEELRFVEGRLEEQLLFDSQGRVQEERRYEEGRLQSRRVLHYGPSGVSRVESYDAEGGLLFEDALTLSARGELVRVRRQDTTGLREELALGARRGQVYEERHEADGQVWLHRYEQGRRVQSERWQEGVLAERESRQYGPEGLLSVLTADLVTGRTTLDEYDERGRLRRSVVEEKGRRVRETTLSWDGQGRLAQKQSRGEQGLEQWSYAYAADGGLAREEYRLRGSLRRVALHGPEGLRVEELYREGELVLRVHWRDGQKLREESPEGAEAAARPALPTEPR